MAEENALATQDASKTPPPKVDVADASEVAGTGGPEQDSPSSDIGRLADFIRKTIRNKASNREFVLSHKSDTGGSVIVTSDIIEPKLSLDDALSAATILAREFHDSALGAVAALNESCTFYVSAYDKKRQPMGLFPFRMSPPPNHDLALKSSTPTERGTLALALEGMKHLLGVTHKTTECALERADAREGKKDDRIIFLENKVDQLQGIIQKTLDEKLQHEREARRDTLIERQSEQVISAGIAFGQIALANKGYSLPPSILRGLGGEDKQADMVKKALALFRSFRPDQLEKMMTIMDPAQHILFAEVADALQTVEAMTPKSAALAKVA